MFLPGTSATYNVVNYRDLEQYVSDLFNHDYSYVVAAEVSNDSIQRYHVRREERDPLLSIAELMQGNPGDLLRELADSGLIPEGTYLIEVCW